ncbi:uncharacterized protein A4U43_C02F9780 [Asparagus officinalis]|uniref:Uncharacterized protein n=1 Tax=Asparagus officinalis TaxID=4686 RepID=A0A5P1FHC8_ASPOF|nr:uncharacterized protein A4U43_C02F9780 [Asparagus officinalis]
MRERRGLFSGPPHAERVRADDEGRQVRPNGCASRKRGGRVQGAALHGSRIPSEVVRRLGCPAACTAVHRRPDRSGWPRRHGPRAGPRSRVRLGAGADDGQLARSSLRRTDSAGRDCRGQRRTRAVGSGPLARARRPRRVVSAMAPGRRYSSVGPTTGARWLASRCRQLHLITPAGLMARFSAQEQRETECMHPLAAWRTLCP